MSPSNETVAHILRYSHDRLSYLLLSVPQFMYLILETGDLHVTSLNAGECDHEIAQCVQTPMNPCRALAAIHTPSCPLQP